MLYTASLFRSDAALPPLIAFAMGTLGFLTPFEAANFEPLLERCSSPLPIIFHSNHHYMRQAISFSRHASVTLYHYCYKWRLPEVCSDWYHISNPCRVLGANEQAVFCTLRTRLCCEVFRDRHRMSVQHAFNEACLDRGLNQNFLQLDCYIDGSYVTTIQVICEIAIVFMHGHKKICLLILLEFFFISGTMLRTVGTLFN